MKQLMWDQRYGGPDYAYGKNPNDFLKSMVHIIPKGKVFCLGEGEGRNAVFLAQLGYEVTALDYSSAGLLKTRQLASENKVKINVIQTDVTHYQFEKAHWQGIISIFFHIPKKERKALHRKCINALAKGGIFILEAYSPRQIEFATGGPKDPDFLMGLEDVKSELDGLKFEVAHEIEREVHEGQYHNGIGSVIQIAAVKT